MSVNTQEGEKTQKNVIFGNIRLKCCCFGGFVGVFRCFWVGFECFFGVFFDDNVIVFILLCVYTLLLVC